MAQLFASAIWRHVEDLLTLAASNDRCSLCCFSESCLSLCTHDPIRKEIQLLMCRGSLNHSQFDNKSCWAPTLQWLVLLRFIHDILPTVWTCWCCEPYLPNNASVEQRDSDRKEINWRICVSGWKKRSLLCQWVCLEDGHTCMSKRTHTTRRSVVCSARVAECINSAASFVPVETAAPSLSQVAAACGSALRPVAVQLTAAVTDSPAQRGSVITTGV